MPTRLRFAAAAAGLLAAVAARAQVSGAVIFSPDEYIGPTECLSTSESLTLSWNVGTVTVPVLSYYRVQVSNTAGCPTTSGDIKTATVGDNLLASATTRTWPSTGESALLASTVVSSAGYGCTETSDKKIYVCVTLLQSGGTTTVATATGSLTLQLIAPTAPTITAVTAGEQALYVTLADGTTNGVDPVKWRVEAVTSDATASDVGVVHTADDTDRYVRVGGLTNGATYEVTGYALGGGGTVSLASPSSSGTPEHVKDFWEVYQDAGGPEKGGCGAGRAGGLGVLLAAAALLLLRPRGVGRGRP